MLLCFWLSFFLKSLFLVKLFFKKLIFEKAYFLRYMYMVNLGLIHSLPNQMFWAAFGQNLTIENIIKYLIQGLAVAFVGYFIPRKKVAFSTIMTVTIAVAISLFVLDSIAPKVGEGARLGVGLAVGYNLINKIPRLGNVM